MASLRSFAFTGPRSFHERQVYRYCSMNVERDRPENSNVMDETRSPSYGKGKLKRALVGFDVGRF